MLRIALRTLRFRTGAFVATFLAMTFGAVLVLACGGLMETGIRSEVTAQRLANTQFVVTGDQSWALPKETRPMRRRTPSARISVSGSGSRRA